MNTFIKPAKTAYENFEKNRSQCNKLSNELRAESKAAINFFVKGQLDKGKDVLSTAPEILDQLQELLTQDPYLNSVGSINEGLEEYAEAMFLLHYIEEKPFPTFEEMSMNHDAYICGICDFTGELVRLARKDTKNAEKIYKDLSALYDECISMFVKRNNKIRSKLESLERNMKRLEIILYEQDLKK